MTRRRVQPRIRKLVAGVKRVTAKAWTDRPHGLVTADYAKQVAGRVRGIRKTRKGKNSLRRLVKAQL